MILAEIIGLRLSWSWP